MVSPRGNLKAYTNEDKSEIDLTSSKKKEHCNDQDFLTFNFEYLNGFNIDFECKLIFEYEDFG